MSASAVLMMLIANYLGLRRSDADYMRLAERWSKVAAITFAVGSSPAPS
jgi:cytochrome d ubiquinol oxidase subunit I